MRKHMPLLLCVALLLTGCSASKPASGNSAADSGKEKQETTTEITTTTAPPPTEHVLVTLGDSISAGYGLADAPTQRYSALLAGKLTDRDGIEWQDCNYAVSGDDSKDLIKRLQNGKALRLPSADAIVICIGGNNLLGPYENYLMNAAGAMQLSPDGLTSDLIGELTGVLEKNRQAAEKLKTDLEEGFTNLENDIVAVYDWIRERNADAPIYLLNVYNPYGGVKLENPIDTEQSFGNYSSDLMGRLNGILSDFAAQHSDVIPVDIASAFAARDPIPIIGNINDYSVTSGTLINVDPHPNPEGQRLIAETVWKAMNPAS